MNWTQYLPPTLQMWQFFLILAIAIAVRGLLGSLPDGKWRLFLIQSVTMLWSMVFAGLIFGAPYPFWSGIGIIAAWAATSFYDMFLGALEAKLRAVLGLTQPTPTPTKTP